jgi:hypothetical protein
MNVRKHTSERGQSLVMVALLFIAFAAILALVLDGGNAYAARRRAQNAADAGALAGASYMCKNKSASGGVTTAVTYAVKNGAVDPPQVLANLNTGSVVVTATVQEDTFFAGLIGVNQVSPRAVAEARCRPPVGIGILPIAWSCRERVVDPEHTLPGISCAEKLVPKDCANPYDLNCTYILMDSVKVVGSRQHNHCDPLVTNPADPNYCYTQNDLVCADPPTDTPPTGEIDCDLNNDGIDELLAGGARSWLDLNGGGGGANELTNWIQNGFPNPIPPHTWLPEESGVATSIFHTAAASTVGKDVILPVFDKLCDRYPDDVTDPETKAACNVYLPYDDRTKASTNMNFHIISFSQFHVTCIQTGRNRVTAEAGLNLHGNDPCPGHDRAVNNNSIDVNDKTIEGYFKETQIYGYGGEGDFVDTGAFVVVLVR